MSRRSRPGDHDPTDEELQLNWGLDPESALDVGSIYSANQMNTFIGGKHQGGIRYSGNFPDIRRIGVILGGGADAIYPDELHASTITYIGEGQEGDQHMSFGNRALVWAHFKHIPIHVFLNRSKNHYDYWGAFGVAAISSTIAPDRNEQDRGAFAFKLERIK